MTREIIGLFATVIGRRETQEVWELKGQGATAVSPASKW